MSRSVAIHQPENLQLGYCFLCDADGPHLSTEIEGVYVFQCTTCFASHTEPLPGTEEPHGRHRMTVRDRLV